MMNTRLGSRIIILIILALGLPACSPGGNSTPALTSVTLQHFWVHGTLFAGFYPADQNGYYAEEGLAVKFVEAGIDTDYLTPVINGTAQFGDAGADELLVARAEGKPLVPLPPSFGAFQSSPSH